MSYLYKHFTFSALCSSLCMKVIGGCVYISNNYEKNENDLKVYKLVFA